jgi:hypothetical protein
MPIYGNSFRRSNKSSLGSNARTNQNQGGGSKKAGLVPTAVMSTATWRAYRDHGLPLSMNRMRLPLVTTTRPTRPVGGNPANYYGKFDTI